MSRTTTRRWTIALVAGLAGLALPTGTLRATGAFDPAEPAATVDPGASGEWARIERLEDPHERMVQEPFIPELEHRDPTIVEAFGDDASPPSSAVLLHHAEGWDEATDPVPVILVPGAGMTATESFGENPVQQPTEGLAARLTGEGKAVFAITFAHPHGDNVLQAEALADAIARVRRVTGAEEVDLVAHSKGGMACRIYVSSAGPDWTTPYRGDVRRYVMLGTPNGGTDVGFAYPNLNYWVLERDFPAPLSWTRCLYRGAWIECRERSIWGDAFPGQPQMVRRWDDPYGLTRAEGQWDVETTYEGGRGVVGVSLGIDRAIEDGDHFMDHLDAHPVDPGVELAVLAGTNPWIMRQIGERRGPSDGLILCASVLATDAMTADGAPLIRRSLLRLNHLQLLHDDRAADWVADVLTR